MPKNTDWKALMHENFGELTAKQLWALTLFAKNVRMRCRNNTAFNNFMNNTFPNARFQTVTKSRISWKTGQSETYPGLQITVKEQTVSDDEGEE